jgi:hypothetical protein
MYASMKASQSSARMAANDLRVWNDALQAALLAIACDDVHPLRSGAMIYSDPCVDCEHKECSRELIIKRILQLKRSPPKSRCGATAERTMAHFAKPTRR